MPTFPNSPLHGLQAEGPGHRRTGATDWRCVWSCHVARAEDDLGIIERRRTKVVRLPAGLPLPFPKKINKGSFRSSVKTLPSHPPSKTGRQRRQIRSLPLLFDQHVSDIGVENGKVARGLPSTLTQRESYNDRDLSQNRLCHISERPLGRRASHAAQHL